MVSIIRSVCGEKISQARLKHRILGNYTTHRNHDSRKSEFLQYKINQAWLKHNFLRNSCNLQNSDNRQEIEGVSFFVNKGKIKGKTVKYKHFEVCLTQMMVTVRRIQRGLMLSCP